MTSMAFRVQAATACIRYEQFAAADVHFDEAGVKWIKLLAIYRQHRKFQRVTIEQFEVVLRNNKDHGRDRYRFWQSADGTLWISSMSREERRL